ncbi:MAG: hypothetical protein ABJ242_01260 [Marinomonas sp.]
MSDMDFEAGRQQGWGERDQYTRERHYAYARSMFGWPLMGIGGLVVLWCMLIYGLSGTGIVSSAALLTLLALGTVVGIFGWRYNKREREEQMHRIDDFQTRWGMKNQPSSSSVAEEAHDRQSKKTVRQLVE